MNPHVAVLGPSTYSEEAAIWLLKDIGWELHSCRTIAEVFESTLSGKTKYSVIPLENTIEGSVSMHIDWLVHDVELPIQIEWVYPILIHLLTFSSGESAQHPFQDKRRAIRKVYSHPVAFAQCRKFLAEMLPQAEFEPVGSTSEGARIVSELKDSSIAAIGPASAAARYGLNLQMSSIQDQMNNFTRFVLVGHEPLPPLKPQGTKLNGSKTTLLLMPNADFPGGLHQLLSAFAWRRLNLTKIESRPTKRELGTYYFYVDVAASLDSILLQGAIQEIEAIGCRVRRMGSYPSFQYELTTNN
jgi:prephenate dehydratase